MVIIRRGARGDVVKELQRALILFGFYEGRVDGEYGRWTASAVENLQRSTGAKVTGEYDIATQEAVRRGLTKLQGVTLPSVPPMPGRIGPDGKPEQGYKIPEVGSWHEARSPDDPSFKFDDIIKYLQRLDAAGGVANWEPWSPPTPQPAVQASEQITGRPLPNQGVTGA